MEQEALNILYDVANAVGPLMEHYGFKVGLLSEMSPKNAQLLGLNVNHGQKIYLRLRPHGMDQTFLPMYELMGTMLHELTHNLFGPHDVKFYKKLDELEDKLNELRIQAIKFAGEGRALGGRAGLDERRARDVKLNRQFQGGVHKLGGGEQAKGMSLQDLVRQAAIKRFEDGKWCHNVAERGDLPQDDDLDIVEVSEKQFLDSRGRRKKERRDVVDVVDVVDLTNES